MKFSKKELVMFGAGALIMLAIGTLLGAKSKDKLETCQEQLYDTENSLNTCRTTTEETKNKWQRCIREIDECIATMR